MAREQLDSLPIDLSEDQGDGGYFDALATPCRCCGRASLSLDLDVCPDCEVTP